jgi:hypothetical protein
VSIAKQDRWKETIPTNWALCELVLRELRRKGKKIIPVRILSKKCFVKSDERSTQMGNILKFFHNLGIILYFDEGSLSETVILDIQWFVDSFKNIITDPSHVFDAIKNDCDWCAFSENGHIQGKLLATIWSSEYCTVDRCYRSGLLQYMEHLGLVSVGKDIHYVPCMNKRTFCITQENNLQSIQAKTSVLVFRFPCLPYFLYFRLIVACMAQTEWEVLKDNEICLFRDLACFLYKEHNVVLAVNRNAIQLQVFKPDNGLIAKDVTLEIRDNVEKLLNGVTGKFHQKITYEVGYQCSKQEVFCEHFDCFVEEEDVQRKGKTTGPLQRLDDRDILSESDLLFYWKQVRPFKSFTHELP